jgi:hypothetical protein
VKTRGTEIDKQAGFDSTGTQITEQLSDVFLGD